MNRTKAQWATPHAERFGGFTELTQLDKDFGPSDGFTVQGAPICTPNVNCVS